MRVVHLVMTVALMTISQVEGAASQNRLCDGRQIVVGTVIGAPMVQDIALANPQYAQMAALVAAVDPAQQDWAKARALESLRAQGYGSYELFDLLLMEARSGQTMKRGIDTVSGAAVGAIIGGTVGTLFKRPAESLVGGGVLGGIAGFTASQYVSIVVDSAIVQPVFARLIRNPCEISAGEALAEIASR